MVITARVKQPEEGNGHAWSGMEGKYGKSSPASLA